MTSRVWALATAAVITAAVSACKAVTGGQSALPTYTDTLSLYSLNGAPAGAPNAISFFGTSIGSSPSVRADASFSFDVAVDVVAGDVVDLYPVRAVASSLAVGHRVGLQLLATSYESVGRAPNTGYHYDSLFVAHAGNVLAVEFSEPFCAGSFLSQSMYAKMAIDSVDILNKKTKLHITVDPNCGFRSFASGVPKD